VEDRVRAKADGVKYVSTRGNAPLLAFDDVVIAGLATDGGLYLPERWPLFTPDALKLMRDLDYPALDHREKNPTATHRQLIHPMLQNSAPDQAAR
jgi:threonine synthase